MSTKEEMKAELVEKLAQDLAALERAYASTRAGATHEEAKPENDKDTRALEQTYLARGQAARIEELRGDVAAVRGMPTREVIEGRGMLGALIALEEDLEERLVLVAPAGGGVRLAGGQVQVVTPKSPLGRALLGKEAGDEVELVASGKRRTMTVLRVS